MVDSNIVMDNGWSLWKYSVVNDSALLPEILTSSTANEPLVFTVAPMLLLLFIHRNQSLSLVSHYMLGRLKDQGLSIAYKSAQPPDKLRTGMFINAVRSVHYLYCIQYDFICTGCGTSKSPTFIYLKLIDIFDFPTVFIGGRNSSFVLSG